MENKDLCYDHLWRTGTYYNKAIVNKSQNMFTINKYKWVNKYTKSNLLFISTAVFESAAILVLIYGDFF